MTREYSRPYRPERLHADAALDVSDLAGVPRVFLHKRCGGQTELTAETVRRYLRDPFRLMGAGSSVFCAGCAKNCRSADCHWVDTGQNVREYYRLLIGEAYLSAPFGWVWRFLIVWAIAAPMVLLLIPLLLYLQGGDLALALTLAKWMAIIAAIGFPTSLLATILTYRRCAAEYRRTLDHDQIS